jgi:hypothetical protein
MPQTGTVAASMAANGSPFWRPRLSAVGIEKRAARIRMAYDIRQRSQAPVARAATLDADDRTAPMCHRQTRRSIQRVGPRHIR